MRIALGELIRSDLDRYAETYRLRGQRFLKRRAFLESLIFKAGFQAVLLYRLSHWFYQRGWTHLAWLAARWNQFLTGAEIEFNAEIGPGLFIAHPGGIVVGRGTKLGRHNTLFQGATFGASSWHPDAIGRFPVAGENCFFCANAVVLGDIRIGDDCVVAAGAVLDKDMPDGSLAKGVPATIHPEKGRRLLRSWRPNDQGAAQQGTSSIPVAVPADSTEPALSGSPSVSRFRVGNASRSEPRP